MEILPGLKGSPQNHIASGRTEVLRVREIRAAESGMLLVVRNVRAVRDQLVVLLGRGDLAGRSKERRDGRIGWHNRLESVACRQTGHGGVKEELIAQSVAVVRPLPLHHQPFLLRLHRASRIRFLRLTVSRLDQVSAIFHAAVFRGKVCQK